MFAGGSSSAIWFIAQRHGLWSPEMKRRAVTP